MNFDYIEITKGLHKDKLCLDYLEEDASYKDSGWIKYYHEGCKALEVWVQPAFSNLKIKGSFPYFMAGQNFQTSLQDFTSSIDYMASILEVNLYEAMVKVFETGAILTTNFHPQFVFDSHIKIKGMKTRTFDNGKYFEDRVLRYKLYDVGANIKKKLSGQDRALLKERHGYDPACNYLKIESHYKNPEVYFKRRCIYVNDLLERDFQAVLRTDFLNKYQSIMKTNQAYLISKKQLTSSTIPLLILKEYEKFLPCSVEDLIKKKIKAIPFDILSKEDKKWRNRQIKTNLKKLEVENSCQYDLSELLMKELKKMEHSQSLKKIA